MKKAFALFLMSFLVAIPLFGSMQLATPHVAHAEQLETEDFFSDDFTDSTGLGQANLKETIAGLIKVFLGFLGIVAVIIVLLGGFKWMTASGSQEKVDDAKKMLIGGVIGMAIILSAYAITEFIVSSILEASS